MEVVMKIGVIGAGNVGGALGRLWAAKGHDIVFGVRHAEDPKLLELLKSIDGNARAASAADSASFGDVVVLATPWRTTEDAIKSAGDLTGKILIDSTNPLTPDISGLTIGTTDSAGEQVARWAPGAKVVKAFNSMGAVNFANPRFGDEAASMFIAGDDAEAKSVVAGLTAELGFDVVDTGPLTTSRWLEAIAALWIHLAFKQSLGPTGHAFKLLRR
jgi:predicted dinucleotide-binding enzyme